MIRAVIDSCIIFGIPLCDTLLRSAEANLYQIILSHKIVEDATRNMVRKGRLKPEKETYYQQQIQKAFPDNFFAPPPELTASMTNAETDRHVVATAIISEAHYIVTFNLKDFPKQSLDNYSITAIHPDDFLVLLCDTCGIDRLKQIIDQQSNALQNPHISPESLLNKLALQHCHCFCSILRPDLFSSN